MLENAKFKKVNVNVKNRKTTDCVQRAISLASGKSYEQVINDGVAIWLKTGYELGDKKNYQKLLEQYGFTKQPQPRKLDDTKYRVKEINQLIGGRLAVITMAHHLSVYFDGEIHDIWDCGNKSIGNYYLLDDF